MATPARGCDYCGVLAVTTCTSCSRAICKDHGAGGRLCETCGEAAREEASKRAWAECQEQVSRWSETDWRSQKPSPLWDKGDNVRRKAPIKAFVFSGRSGNLESMGRIARSRDGTIGYLLARNSPTFVERGLILPWRKYHVVRRGGYRIEETHRWEQVQAIAGDSRFWELNTDTGPY